MGLATDTSPKTVSSLGASQIGQGILRGLLSPRLLVVLLILAGWWLVSGLYFNRAIPSPPRVAGVMWELFISGEFFRHLGISMYRIVVGFLVAFLVGITVGVLMGSRRWWEAFFKDIVLIGISIPGLIYAMMSVMIFGLSILAPLVAITGASYPFVAVNVFEGVRALDRDLLDMSRVYRVGRAKVIRQVVLPALMPFIFAAIRVGFAIAWKVSTITEVFGASSGVGYMIRASFDQFSVRGMIAWTLLFAGVMLFIEYGILVPTQRYLARWRREVVEQVI